MNFSSVIRNGAPKFFSVNGVTRLHNGRVEKMSNVSATLLACVGIGVSSFGIKQMMTEVKPYSRRHLRIMLRHD